MVLGMLGSKAREIIREHPLVRGDVTREVSDALTPPTGDVWAERRRDDRLPPLVPKQTQNTLVSPSLAFSKALPPVSDELDPWAGGKGQAVATVVGRNGANAPLAPINRNCTHGCGCTKKDCRYRHPYLTSDGTIIDLTYDQRLLYNQDRYQAYLALQQLAPQAQQRVAAVADRKIAGDATISDIVVTAVTGALEMQKVQKELQKQVDAEFHNQNRIMEAEAKVRNPRHLPRFATLSEERQNDLLYDYDVALEATRERLQEKDQEFQQEQKKPQKPQKPKGDKKPAPRRSRPRS